ncbi:PEP-CTERM putative exosortase interaction domain-containing protein [Opitutaceae bacterium TAV1]|nr:PEP-CTERM putative exosortase interaction domain-containing protein [Opitutaceae bacterium TAV1]
MKRYTFVSAVAAALLASVTLSAQEQLVSYEFGTGLAPTVTNTALLESASAFVYSGEPTTGGYSSANGGNIYSRLNSLGSTLADGKNWSFSITPKQALDLGELSFNIGYQNISVTTHPGYTLHYQVGIKIGDEAEVLINPVFDYVVATSSTGTSSLDGSASLDLSVFRNVNSSVVFTLYIWATDISGGSRTVNETARIDNVRLAIAPVPEPAHAALFLGGVLGLLLLVRRCGFHRAA